MSVGNVCILVILNYHIVYVLAFRVYGFKAPKQVIGIVCTCCPCCDEIRTTNLEISTSIGTVYRFAEIIIAVFAHVICFGDGKFVECPSYGSTPVGTSHHGMSVTVFNPQFCCLVGYVPDTIVCFHLGV